MAKRQRLSSDTRRAQLVAAAIPLILEQGYLPLPTERLAGAVGASKALVYSYFPTQHDLFNAVLREGAQALQDAGLDEAAARPELGDAALATARIYFRQVAAQGPFLHIILRDLYMAGHVDPLVARTRDRVARRLARAARRELRLPAREAVAAYSLIQTLPEELGRLAWQGVMTVERGEALLDRLVASAIKALIPV